MTMHKDALRAQLKQRCQTQMPEFNTAHNAAVTQVMQTLIEKQADAGACIALYRPMSHEVDTGLLMQNLAQQHYQLALPAVTTRHAPLQFRAYHVDDILIVGAYGLPVPSENSEIMQPDIIIVPILGFTQAGYRLGYGGGYYDRTLGLLPQVKTIGLAASFQQIDFMPEPHDKPLDWIVTETNVLQLK